jgi:hypothetical protein
MPNLAAELLVRTNPATVASLSWTL